jgi:excisionase family DNA binding protein
MCIISLNGIAIAIKEHHMLYTVEQVADILQVSPQTVRRLIKEGQIKAVRVGIQLRVKKEELDRYLESQST